VVRFEPGADVQIDFLRRREGNGGSEPSQSSRLFEHSMPRYSDQLLRARSSTVAWLKNAIGLQAQVTGTKKFMRSNRMQVFVCETQSVTAI